MLSYLRRTIPALVRARLGRDGRLVSHVEGRVGLAQLDLNLHMNQAVYPQLVELGRVDWLVRSGAWAHWRAQSLNAVVADQRLVYRRELKLGQRYAIDTRCVGMDGRLLHMSSLILVGDRVHTRCEVKLIFIGPGGVLSAEEAADSCEGFLSPPAVVEDWRLVR
ncbi:acyl-CoA thioesterase [Pseudenhygromyxa sp. WMMC2535]|uniref:thioesterase family protein n=1 Tax=Pseudenhygromyxa sp. WMMC2535 TaxID=2712867 RepID=UPI001557314F|nr:acyl-CoA thioesterase [Pseudenhygromyxa sp. WMMC2535]